MPILIGKNDEKLQSLVYRQLVYTFVFAARFFENTFYFCKLKITQIALLRTKNTQLKAKSSQKNYSSIMILLFSLMLLIHNDTVFNVTGTAVGHQKY